MSQFVVGVSRRQFQFENEAVDLVDAERDCEPLLNGMLDQSLRVQHNLNKYVCTCTCITVKGNK